MTREQETLSHEQAAAANVREVLEAGPSDWSAVKAQLAVAQATLALVEQQRIANLIAILEGGSAHALRDEGAGDEPTGQRNVLRAQIRKGLGL